MTFFKEVVLKNDIFFHFASRTEDLTLNVLNQVLDRVYKSAQLCILLTMK